MNKDNYIVILRIVGSIAAVLMWVISTQFSMDGFNISIPEKQWIAIALAICITVIELVWNKTGMTANLTIIMVGLMSYIYGIWTNVIGIMGASGTSLDGGLGNPLKLVLPLVLGIFLEITPEALFVWGLTGDSNTGDFLSNIFGKLSQGADGFKPQPMQMPSQHFSPPPPQPVTPVVMSNGGGNGGNNGGRPPQGKPSFPTGNNQGKPGKMS